MRKSIIYFRYSSNFLGKFLGNHSKKEVKQKIIHQAVILFPVFHQHISQKQQYDMIGTRMDEPVWDAQELIMPFLEALKQKQVTLKHLIRDIPACAKYGCVHPRSTVFCQQFQSHQIRILSIGNYSFSVFFLNIAWKRNKFFQIACI